MGGFDLMHKNCTH